MDAKAIFAKNWPRYRREWETLLRFPTVSANPAHHPDCLACAGWLRDRLRIMGFNARLLGGGSCPVVYGSLPARRSNTVILFYGHYDVQPEDPLDHWRTAPFRPSWRAGRMYARGASDNKGPLWCSLVAMEALIRSGVPLPGIRIVLEGEEESGGQTLARVLTQWPDRFRSDVVLVGDCGMAPGGIPAVTVGLRGIIHATIELRGARQDLHSGVHGGVAPNPAHGIARLIASLHRPDGSLAVRDIRESAPVPTRRERRLANAVRCTAQEYRAAIGVAPLAGERRFTIAERVGLRPSLDVNGLYSGYQGQGIKTIIPSTAVVKISVRLVAGQDPRRCLDALLRHVRTHTPRGFRLRVVETGIGAPALRTSPDAPLVKRAQALLGRLTGRRAVCQWMGGSIPTVARLVKVSGGQLLMVGYSMHSDHVHAPNESFSLQQFRLGFLYTADMLQQLASGNGRGT